MEFEFCWLIEFDYMIIKYVLIMIEHVFKWLELMLLWIPTMNKKTYAFLDRVFIKFGILVKIFTHRREEFHEKFQKLSNETLYKSLYNFTRPF
jgi:hypothetical protein